MTDPARSSVRQEYRRHQQKGQSAPQSPKPPPQITNKGDRSPDSVRVAPVAINALMPFLHPDDVVARRSKHNEHQAHFQLN